MGCCGERQTNLIHIEDEKTLQYTAKGIIDVENYKTNDINEDFILNFYLKSQKEESLEGLFKLIDNHSLIIVKDFEHEWISPPKTMGDLSLIQIMYILKKMLSVEMEPYDENPNEANNVNTKYMSRKSYINLFEGKESNYSLYFINKSHFVKKMFDVLANGSYSQKDCCLVLLCAMSINRGTCSFLKKKETIDSIMRHVTGYYIKRYKNYNKHVMICLQILRNIYVKDVELRKHFINVQGVSFLQSLLKSKSKNYEFVNEVLISFEDLIYKDDDILNQGYNSISKVIVTEIIDTLVNLKVHEYLFEFFNENLNDEKMGEMKDEFNRLFVLFSTRIEKK